jgi:hypothetical protein
MKKTKAREKSHAFVFFNREYQAAFASYPVKKQLQRSVSGVLLQAFHVRNTRADSFHWFLHLDQMDQLDVHA